jgi:thiamine kinase-like enzyme
MRNGARPPVFPGKIPWILSFHEMGEEVASGMSAANWRMLQILREDPEFPGALAAARNKWQPSTLIHGDIKWDNTLVSRTGEHTAVRLVDWELADFGDPCWDAGAVLQTYLSAWIFSMDPAAATSPDQLVSSARRPLSRMQPAIQAFWNSYAAGMGADGGKESELLERSMIYCAARMIQTAYEQMHYASALTAPGVSLLQTTLNILTNPRQAIEHLLGM